MCRSAASFAAKRRVGDLTKSAYTLPALTVMDAR
jgi:hypothetical protein